MKRVGVIALARPTFDVAYAADVAAQAFGVLESVVPESVGPRNLLFDTAETAAAIEELLTSTIDVLIVLQVTFTDASMTKVLADALEVPIVFWSFPEERTGGRLRLNSLCGINLAGFTLKRDGHRPAFMYRRPNDPEAPDELLRLINGDVPTDQPIASETKAPSGNSTRRAREVADTLGGLAAGVIGDYPTGFDPCSYDAAAVRQLTGVSVQRLELADLFSAADAATVEAVAAARGRANDALGSLDELDQTELEQSLRIYCGLQQIAGDNTWSALATRCWPECFTEYGGAACAPQAMLTEDGIPGGCEADVYGSLTSLILRETSGEPPFVADLVDVDMADDSAVFWHCGVAPLHMADPAVTAGPTVHSNRRKPLLHEFPLKPGLVTIARLSQAGGSHSLVIGSGEMLRAPLAYSGTAGVIRFDRAVGDVLRTILSEGLEHHYGIAYGNHREVLTALANLWGIRVIELT